MVRTCKPDRHLIYEDLEPTLNCSIERITRNLASAKRSLYSRVYNVNRKDRRPGTLARILFRYNSDVTLRLQTGIAW
jgi:hypothetical protein